MTKETVRKGLLMIAMRIRNAAAIFAVFVVLQTMRSPAAQTHSKPFFFIQIADTQYGHHSRPRNLDFLQESANNDFLVTTINRLRPAFVVVCGDLINQGMNVGQMREYKKAMAKLDPSIHLYNVPGNHDVDPANDASMKFYAENFGPDHYTFHEQTLEGIVLDSELISEGDKAPQSLARSQDEWLRTELAKAKADGVPHILVFQHHPWFISDVDEEDHYYNLPKGRRRSYLDVFSSFGVQAILSGHTHYDLVREYHAIRLITTGAAGGEANFGSRNGLTAVVVRESGMEARYYDLGWIPNKIDPEQPLAAPPAPELPH
jgi:3',5'-cyclic AMP phosphodiesterase CpdA